MQTPPNPMISVNERNNLLAGYETPVEVADTTFDSPLLRLLITAERAHLVRSFTERRCVPGEIIFREGEAGDIVYLIYAGRAVVLKGDFASPTILGYRAAGDIIGEMAVLEQNPRSASVVALDNVRLMGMSRENFQQLLRDTPTVALGIMSVLSSRLRHSDEFRSKGEISEKHLIGKVSELQTEKKRLEQLQRLQQETSDLIIHDLRNPLSTISVAVKMLELTLPEDMLQANRELLDIAMSGCERLQRLVENLLEVSRMEAGETELVWEPVNLEEMIRNSLTRISILDQKGIDIQVHIPVPIPLISADRDKLERVITNLVDNAIKYTPARGQITVSAQAKGKYVYISVTDSGPGIAPEERQRIFERFAQSSGEKRKRRGFGLGLAYCRLAIEAHGGKIWVEAGEGGSGSRFVFTLPVKPKN